MCTERRTERPFKLNSVGSGYGEIYWLQSFVGTEGETVPQTGAGNMSQTGANSYGDSDSNATQL